MDRQHRVAEQQPSLPRHQRHFRHLRTQPYRGRYGAEICGLTLASPAGTDISPYYVLSYPDWVHVVAVTPERDLVLVRLYRHAVGKMVLELPGGMLDSSDASIEHAARRELEEETGYTARNWQLVSSLYPNPATHTNQLHVYLATHATCDRVQSLDEGEEGMEVCIVPVQEVVDGLRAGGLGQATHVSAVLLALVMAGLIKLGMG